MQYTAPLGTNLLDCRRQIIALHLIKVPGSERFDMGGLIANPIGPALKAGATGKDYWNRSLLLAIQKSTRLFTWPVRIGHMDCSEYELRSLEFPKLA